MIRSKTKLGKGKYKVTDGNKCAYIVKRQPAYKSKSNKNQYGCGQFVWFIILDGEWLSAEVSLKNCLDQIKIWCNHSNKAEGI